jgi:short-subunit dehydrogenase
MILVTGATGNIGRELARELDLKGAKLRVLVRDPDRAAGLPDRAERSVGDLAASTSCSCSRRASAPTSPSTPSPPLKPPG